MYHPLVPIPFPVASLVECAAAFAFSSAFARVETGNRGVVSRTCRKERVGFRSFEDGRFVSVYMDWGVKVSCDFFDYVFPAVLSAFEV
jgi:hypothetical protein